MIIPNIGLGTFRLKGQQVIDSVSSSLALGYRHIDTAQIYANEAEVGQAIAASGIPRQELFVTTKIWIENLSREKLISSLQHSLEKLRTDQVDLTLIHWPSPDNAVHIAEYMQALAEAKAQGLTRLIGLSNFPNALLQRAIDLVSSAEIATHQIEIHPFLQNRKAVSFAQSKGIHLTAYMPLAYGKVMHDPIIAKIAERHKATAAQVALAWSLQQGFAVIPSSTQRQNQKKNLAARQLHLSSDEMTEMASLDANIRLANPAGIAPAWD